MNDIIEEEFQMFLDDIKDNGFIFGRYLDEDYYEDEYCHNDINEAQYKLQEKIEEYLKVNRPNEFVVTGGWCVFVMTPDRARKSHMHEQTIERCLVKKEEEE